MRSKRCARCRIKRAAPGDDWCLSCLSISAGYHTAKARYHVGKARFWMRRARKLQDKAGRRR